MSLHQKILDLRRRFSNVRKSTLLIVVAVLFAVSSVAATSYTIGSLNDARAETRIIRQDLSREQAQRLADAERRVQELALRDRRIMAQQAANRELILTLRSLIERRPDLFVGVDLPPSLANAKPIAGTGKPKPKPNKPKPNKPKPNKPKPGTHGPDPRVPNPPVPPTNPQPPIVPLPPRPVPPILPPGPPTIPPVIEDVLCWTPLTCGLVNPK